MLDEMGMKPYYLYRQKNMAGNQENVGYSLPGKGRNLQHTYDGRLSECMGMSEQEQLQNYFLLTEKKCH